MQHYKIMFSIPVHERPEVVLDQIMNFRFFNPDCGIVLHISSSFNGDSELAAWNDGALLEHLEGVYVNPDRLQTARGNIVHVHISNFEYAVRVADFEYFMHCASNDLFVKPGLYEQISAYDTGVQVSPQEDLAYWDYTSLAHDDAALQNILREFSLEEFYHGQAEGLFYKRSVGEQMVSVYHRNYVPFTSAYHREEVFPHTILLSLVKQLGLKNMEKRVTYINWDSMALLVGPRDLRIAKKAKGYYFCVKRVDRRIDDPLRVYIRQNIGNYFDAVQAVLPNLKARPFSAARFYVVYGFLAVWDMIHPFASRVKQRIKKILA